MICHDNENNYAGPNFHMATGMSRMAANHVEEHFDNHSNDKIQ